LSFQLIHFKPFSHIYWWKEVLNNLILPIVDSSVSLALLSSIFRVFYVHACIVLEITDRELGESFSEQIITDICDIKLRSINTILQSTVALLIRIDMLELPLIIHIS